MSEETKPWIPIGTKDVRDMVNAMRRVLKTFPEFYRCGDGEAAESALKYVESRLALLRETNNIQTETLKEMELKREQAKTPDVQ